MSTCPSVVSWDYPKTSILVSNIYDYSPQCHICTAGVYTEVCNEGMSIVQFKQVETTPQMWYRLDDIKVTKATQGPHI